MGLNKRASNQKEQVIHSHFKNIAKKGPTRNIDIDWGIIPTPNCDLQELDAAITEEEVKATVFALPSDKAPGPDGFTGAFFKACWNIIKEDLMSAICRFSDLHATHFH